MRFTKKSFPKIKVSGAGFTPHRLFKTQNAKSLSRGLSRGIKISVPRPKPRDQKCGAGFTLIELLITIAIIGIFSTLAIVKTNQYRAKARDAERVSDIKTMEKAVELYIEDNGSPPTLDDDPTWEELATKLNGYVAGGIPSDPVGDKTYMYCHVGNLYLLGAALEVDTDFARDIDGNQDGYTCFDCLFIDGICLISPDCDDNGQGQIGNDTEVSALCLGYENP